MGWGALIWQIWRMTQHCATPFLAQNCWTTAAVCGRVLLIAEKKELQISPHFWPHTGNTLTQTVQNLNVKGGVHCLTFRYIFMVNYTFIIKKQNPSSLPLIFEIEIFWRVVHTGFKPLKNGIKSQKRL